MKDLKILLLFCVFSCQTTRYHDPINMTQSQIEKMTIVERKTGVSSQMQAGKLFRCPEGVLDKEKCTITICKSNKAQISGYDCQIFVPVDQVESAGMVEYKNDFVQKMVEDKVNDYNEGREQSLSDFCKKDNVLCYLDRKFYPFSKAISSKAIVRTVYKNTYISKQKNFHVIEVNVYEIK